MADMTTTAVQVRERPILFSGAMVRGILEDRKSQTRCVMNPQPALVDGRGKWRVRGDGRWPIFARKELEAHLVDICPYGKVGDLLWVREGFSKCTGCNDGNGVIFRADYENGNGPPSAHGWKPSIHMPRKYSRLMLEVANVRIERVQEISEEDAIAEGIFQRIVNGKPAGWHWLPYSGFFGDWGYKTARIAYQHLWESINAERGMGWSKNPWVWCTGFKRVQP